MRFLCVSFAFEDNAKKKWGVNCNLENFPFMVEEVLPGGQFFDKEITKGMIPVSVNGETICNSNMYEMKKILTEGIACTISFLIPITKELLVQIALGYYVRVFLPST
eukprot:UN28318